VPQEGLPHEVSSFVSWLCIEIVPAFRVECIRCTKGE
jgi:hypothetical protein